LLMKSSGAVLDKRDYSVPSPVDWVCGACMMVRSSAIAQSGLMDERYFMYVEDMDWCRRFRINGWQVWYLPYWTIEHNASRGSSGKTGINNRLMWIHIASLTKYMLKWFTTTHEESDNIGK
jgi:N-acetylglucosaminyl-diphospho-decaprenol L-rhamnosyltransferase